MDRRVRIAPRSPGACLAEWRRPHGVGGQAARARRRLEAAWRLVEWLVRQIKCAVVDAERARRAEVERGSDGLLGVEVYGAHHRDRLVGADRQHGETERTEAAPDLGEPREVAAVAREVESPRRTDDDPSAPERRALIGEAAPAPMLARYEMQLDAGDRTRVPPVELLDRGDAGSPEQIADAQRNEKARVPRSGEHPQRREVEVVVVVVRHEHEVD